ncbi:MAG: hypothetical protein GX575_09370, partial [Candidatus Anammoximicrobium sp.]|nr:hypothetical protein [Candidatus Anammoximicrobium sp.]
VDVDERKAVQQFESVGGCIGIADRCFVKSQLGRDKLELGAFYPTFRKSWNQYLRDFCGGQGADQRP